MKLILYRDSLRESCQSFNCSQIEFYMFTDEVQAAIRAVGKATFMEYDHTNHNAIYPPQPEGK